MRFPRTVAALAAAGTAACVLGLSAAPVAADQVRNDEWWLRPLGITAAWPATRGSGVTVAVLSDGVAGTSPDLAGAVRKVTVPGAPAAAGRFLGEQGTPIASLIAGRGHGPGGASGIIGVAPGAGILSVPVTLPADDPQRAASSAALPAAIAAGIRTAVNGGAKVIDLPLDLSPPAGGGPAERAAVQYAVSKNVVVVAPAGDNGQAGDAVNWPAGYPGVISVGALSRALTLTPWSVRRSYVTLAGPGADVAAASAAGGYQTLNSSAAASAVVAGVAALIRSRYPGLSAAGVRQALITTSAFAAPHHDPGGLGYGPVNAADALTVAAAAGAPGQSAGGAGAQPAVTPAAAPPAAAAHGLGSQLLQAAEVSAAVLIVLLAAVAGYSLATRRRRRAGPGVSLAGALAAEWPSGHSQSRYPAVAPLTDGDRMLDVFAAPAVEPEPAGRRGASSPDLTIRSGSHSRPGLFAAAPADRAERAGASAQAAAASRPAVSGTPPWEPASAPADDPWGDEPARRVVPGEVVSGGFPAAGDYYAAAADRSRRLTGREPGGAGEHGRPPALRAADPRAAGQAAGRGRDAVPEPGASPDGGSPVPEPRAARGVRGRLAGRLPGVRRPGGHAAGQPAGPAGGAAGYPGERAASGSADVVAHHPSGLPIRQPRKVATGPASPGSTLWQPARRGGEAAEPASGWPGSEPAGSWADGDGGGWADADRGNGDLGNGSWADGGWPDGGAGSELSQDRPRPDRYR